MEEKRTSRLYRGIRWGVKLVFPKFRLVEAEQLPETPCVIVGKAAGFVLKNEANLVRVFVHAPYWFLRQEAAKRNSLTDRELDKYIEKENKRRADYNYYYTGEKWDDAHNYDLCVDASKLGFEKCVKIIEGYMKVRFDGLQF